MSAMIGHNGGPSLAKGAGFRKAAWSKARAELLPALPLEVVRLRVARAKRLGLPYKTYATIRAVSGRDIVGFLFSSNALDMRGGAAMPAQVRDRVDALDGIAARLAAIHAPIDVQAVLANGGLEVADRAPGLMQGWRETRDQLRGMAQEGGVPADGLVVVAATALERDWCVTGSFGGVIGREALFGA